jgi:hypothetical protein
MIPTVNDEPSSVNIYGLLFNGSTLSSLKVSTEVTNIIWITVCFEGINAFNAEGC